MATVCCPNCNSEFKKPTSAATWILVTLGAICTVGFMLLILAVICLSAISAVGTASNEAFDEIAAQIELDRASNDQTSYQAVGK